MISLKRYLDLAAGRGKTNQAEEPCEVLFSAYLAALKEIGECGVDVCPALGPDLVRSVAKISETLRSAPSRESIGASETAVRDLLGDWGTRTAKHYDRKAEEVKDLLLVMARTAESLGLRDDRYARQLSTVTLQLESIANLDDVSRIRASVKSSARELQSSIAKMTTESKAVIDHLRAEVSTFQTKLEKAEHIASCDALTGLGSRRWIESRILQRIEDGSPFSIVLIDINDFSRVVEDYGNLVGDLLLKEFARELRSSCRFTDIVGRWGGDEFIVILDHGGPETEVKVARLQTWIARSYHVPGRTGYVSVRLDISVGVAEHRAGEDLQDVLERADAELCLRRGSAKAEKTA